MSKLAKTSEEPKQNEDNKGQDCLITSQTKEELKRCLDYLDSPDPRDPNHSQGIEGAIRGLNDWFAQAVFEEFPSIKVKTKWPQPSNANL